jgi:hypothetical protein
MALTARDLEILSAVHRHRLLRSTHLVALTGASRQAILRRLQLLFHHSYLDRPLIQLDWYARGSEPMVYALGRRGAEALAQRGEVHRRGVRWDTKNRNLSRVFLHHTLAVAEVMVAFDAACRQRPDVDFIRADDILAAGPAATRGLQRPFRWQIDARAGGKRHQLGVEPDGVLGVRFRGLAPNRSRQFFFVEADRGTMPVVRKGLTRSSFARKLLAYRETWRQAVHKAHFGIPGFRVLTVTASPERLGHLVAACRSLPTGGARLFLFAPASQLSAGNVLTMPWVDGRGQPAKLLEPSRRTPGHLRPTESP